MTARRGFHRPVHSDPASLHDWDKFLAHKVFLVRVRSNHTTTSAELKISGAVSTPLTLTAADLSKMPRKTLSVTNPHNKKTEVYEGVRLEDLLRRAGIPQHEQLRGQAMATYVVAEAEDGYKVVFSLAELDSGILLGSNCCRHNGWRSATR